MGEEKVIGRKKSDWEKKVTGKIATVPTARTPSGLGSHGQG